MNILDEGCGIDVDSKCLEVRFGGKSLGRFPNSPAGLQKICKRVPLGTTIHLEATGGYERLARRTLTKLGYEVRLHNPRDVRRVAEGLRVTPCKTDREDAKALATVGPILKSRPAKSEIQERLCDISRAIHRLQEQRTANDHHLHAPLLDPACVKAFKKLNAFIEKQITVLEAEFVLLIKQSPLYPRYRAALSTPCIGPCTARVLACEIQADLSNLHSKQIASYACLAPIDDSSGASQGRKHLSKANRHIKAAMYMPAMCAIAVLPWAKELYSRLKSHGRSHKEAIVPVMHKLLRIVASVMIRGTAYTPEPPQYFGLK